MVWYDFCFQTARSIPVSAPEKQFKNSSSIIPYESEQNTFLDVQLFVEINDKLPSGVSSLSDTSLTAVDISQPWNCVFLLLFIGFDKVDLIVLSVNEFFRSFQILEVGCFLRY